MKTITLTHIGELVDAVRSLVHNSGLRWWFRGHRDCSWDLLPSAKRDYTEEQERYMTNEFYGRAKTRHSACPPKNDFAAWLSLMQHFGLPTRLLDWSNSPLIAAFFATEHGRGMKERGPEYDSCLWGIAPGKLNETQGFEPYLYPLDSLSLRSLIRPAFKGHDRSEKIAAAWAVESDPRMQVQQGAFTIHSSKTPLNQMYEDKDWLCRMVIPGKYVPILAEEIYLLGFRRGDLFPDLDNLALELKRHHLSAVKGSSPTT